MKRSHESGLSLLEILISICILIIVFFTVYEIFVTGLKFYNSTKSSTLMMKLAQQQFELLVADRKSTGPTVTSPPGSGEIYQPFPAPNSNCSYCTKYDKRPYNHPPGGHAADPFPDYDVYDVTLCARGPFNPDGSDNQLYTKTIILKTTISPIVDTYPAKCAVDENRREDASNLPYFTGGKP